MNVNTDKFILVCKAFHSRRVLITYQYVFPKSTEFLVATTEDNRGLNKENWTALLAPENAIGQYNRISDKILKPDYLPERFKILDSEPEHSREIRRMPINNYSVFYIIKGNRAIVTDILYSTSDISKRLKG